MSNYMDRFTNAEATITENFSKLPTGDYTAKITDIDIKEENYQGLDQTKLSVELTITKPEQFAGRKTWWNTTLSEKTTDKAFSFIKGQICKMAGIESTMGNPIEALTASNGNDVEINLTYKPSLKDPNKEYPQVFFVKKVDELIPF